MNEPHNLGVIFGMVDISEQSANGYMEVVPNDAIGLTYNDLQSLPSESTHEWVNHSVNFVSTSCTHTQNIESYWNRMKIKLERMRGRHEHQLTRATCTRKDWPNSTTVV